MRPSEIKGTDEFRVEITGPDGSLTTAEVIRSRDGYLVRRDGTAVPSGMAGGAVADPVALVQAALVVDVGTRVRITPAVWGPSASELLAALRIDPSALDGEQGDDRFDVEVDLAERVVAVPCGVGGDHVAGLVYQGRVVPVLLDDDGEQLAGEEIARYTWFSESGGAPVSWDGGAELLRLNGALGLDLRWGDMEPGSSLVELPAEGEALAELVAAWLCEDEGSVLGAAFGYEPLDPGGSLSAEEREQWQDLLGAVELSVSLTLDDAILALVLQRLSRQDDYAAVKDALAHPTGPNGQKLRRALMQYADAGHVLGDVLNWRTD